MTNNLRIINCELTNINVIRIDEYTTVNQSLATRMCLINYFNTLSEFIIKLKYIRNADIKSLTSV